MVIILPFYSLSCIQPFIKEIVMQTFALLIYVIFSELNYIIFREKQNL